MLRTVISSAGWGAGTASGIAALESFPYAEITIDAAQAQMREGSLTAVQLTQAYLDRIAAIDAAGPQLNAVIEVNPAALAIAKARDAERAAGHVRGPLHGIPILIKDNIATADEMQTTAGSLALVDARPSVDADVTARLRDAGAVLLGKTNLSEWANFRSTRSTSGWSGRGGQTHNPYALDRSPSGSSSGSAVAVAANLCVVAVGTETDGSVVSPSSVNGIVGIKPTVGLVSRAGIIPISTSQDTAGPMARTVRDAVLLLEAMAGRGERDAATLAQPEGAGVGLVDALRPGALQGKRLGVFTFGFGEHPRMAVVLAQARETLTGAGAELIDVPLPDRSAIGAAEIEVLRYEFKDGLNAWFRSLGDDAPVKSLADLICFNLEHRDREMPFFDQEEVELSELKGPLTEPEYLEALATSRRLTRDDGIDQLIAEHELDALICLTNGPAWMIDPVNGDNYTGGSSTLAAVSGYPAITVPAGQNLGLPIGLTFIGPAWSEAKVFALAGEFETLTQARRPPTFPPTVVLP